MARDYDGPATLVSGGYEIAVHAILRAGPTGRPWNGKLTPADEDDSVKLLGIRTDNGMLRLPDGRTDEVALKPSPTPAWKAEGIGSTPISAEINVEGAGSAPF